MHDEKLKVEILPRIIDQTRVDVEERKRRTPLDVVKRSHQGLGATLERPFESAIAAPKKGDVAIIAEIKLASPSEPDLGRAEDITSRAKAYEQAGIDAISVVTEKHFFNGDPSYVGEIKQATTLPVLQKDFIIDQYQIYEVKQAGADAILLIARLLDKEQLQDFVELAFSLGLEPVVEVNDEKDVAKAIGTKTEIIAVNARDLHTMQVDVDGACDLLTKTPDEYVKLGFSGINGREEIEEYRKAGAKGVLVGTSLMKAENIQEFIQGLYSNDLNH